MNQELINKILRLREYVSSVRSSNVSRIKWDSETKELTIRFRGGDTYTYFNVPESVYNNVEDGNAGTKTSGSWGDKGKFPSVGAAVHQWLIDAGFRYRKGGTI